MTRKDDPSREHDELDDWLAAARWPEAGADVTKRLTATWRRLNWRHRLRAHALHIAIGAAAAVLLVWVGKTSLNPTRTRQQIAVAPRVPKTQAPTLSEPLAGREPTSLEMAMIRAEERREAKLKTRPPLPPANAPAVDPAVLQERLTRLIITNDSQLTPALAREFSQLATARHLPLLRMLARQPKLRMELVDALARLGDVQTLTELARSDVSAPDRRTVIAAILNSRTPDSLAKYLDLAADPVTKRDALATLDEVVHPPTDALLAQLQSPRADLRIAAALVLGKIDGPVVTGRLIEMVRRDQSRREALIALASSRGEAAQAFMKRAVASEGLSGQARSAVIATEMN